MSPQSALGFGYGESKWVCERVAASVAEKTTLRPVIVRIGQIAGSSSGAWKPSEWVPSIIKSSIHLGALPTEDKVRRETFVNIILAIMGHYRRSRGLELRIQHK